MRENKFLKKVHEDALMRRVRSRDGTARLTLSAGGPRINRVERAATQRKQSEFVLNQRNVCSARTMERDELSPKTRDGSPPSQNLILSLR